jgi:23S rRNA pseudouridine1911/1915/1917 synthase
LVECELLTGRTHQIRLHLSFLGAPILGDTLYGGASLWLDADKHQLSCSHPMLHAWKLYINHPSDGRQMHFTAPLPIEYVKIMTSFGITTACIDNAS